MYMRVSTPARAGAPSAHTDLYSGTYVHAWVLLWNESKHANPPTPQPATHYNMLHLHSDAMSDVVETWGRWSLAIGSESLVDPAYVITGHFLPSW